MHRTRVGRPCTVPRGPADLLQTAGMTDRRKPYDVVRDHTPGERASKKQLLRHVRDLERRALDGPAVAFAVACLQDARFLTDATVEVYAELARLGAQVLVLGRGVQAFVAPGVRGIDLADDDPLGDEWTVLLAGRSFTCFVAHDLHVPVDDDDERDFEWAQTDDPSVVAEVYDILSADIRGRADDIAVEPYPGAAADGSRLTSR